MTGNRPKKENEQLPYIEIMSEYNYWEIRYNFQEIPEKTLENGEIQPPSFNYEYVKPKNLTKKEIKVEIIHQKYEDFNDELATINNKETGKQNYIDNYNEYMEYRQMADDIAIETNINYKNYLI